MEFERDIAVIEGVVHGGDPAFDRVSEPLREQALSRLRDAAREGGRDRFLLEAMGVIALGRNAHSRVIPNAAILVTPRRIVIRDGHPAWVEHGRATRILAVNGLASSRVMSAWEPLLAGNAVRRRVLSGLMLGWPAALEKAGAGAAPDIHYRLATGARRVFSRRDLVPALPLYPTGETGALLPGQDDHGLPDGAFLERRAGLWWWRIADLSSLEADRVAHGLAAMSEQAGANAVIDLRGNPGGSFLRALPLLDWLRSTWRGTRCAVLVDDYTFSAAIVTAALITSHLGPRARLFGSAMGDDLAFFAEGGMTPLPDSGAHLRHSSAWHDWQDGRVADSTPAEIAAHMIAAGPLCIIPCARAVQEATACAYARGV